MTYRQLVLKILEHRDKLNQEVVARTFENHFIKIKDLSLDNISDKLLLEDSYARNTHNEV